MDCTKFKAEQYPLRYKGEIIFSGGSKENIYAVLESNNMAHNNCHFLYKC